MKIGRKEALIALIAGVVPFLGRKASAQIPRGQVREPLTLADPAQEMAVLQKRVAALEAQLANQVGFTRDAAGNLNLRGAGSVRLESTTGLTVMAGMGLDLRSGANLDVRAGAGLDMRSNGTTSVKGSVVALN